MFHQWLLPTCRLLCSLVSLASAQLQPLSLGTPHPGEETGQLDVHGVDLSLDSPSRGGWTTSRGLTHITLGMRTVLLSLLWALRLVTWHKYIIYWTPTSRFPSAEPDWSALWSISPSLPSLPGIFWAVWGWETVFCQSQGCINTVGREERWLFSMIQYLSDPAALGNAGPVESLQSVSGEWSSPLASPSLGVPQRGDAYPSPRKLCWWL